MVFVNNQYCITCGKQTEHSNFQCIVCAERERRTTLAAWQAQTVEEKLLDLHQRLLEQEKGDTIF